MRGSAVRIRPAAPRLSMVDIGNITTESAELPLSRCPHCGIARPHLNRATAFHTNRHDEKFPRLWGAYACRSCGGVVLAASRMGSGNHPLPIIEIYPELRNVSDDVPERPRRLLQEALDA